MSEPSARGPAVPAAVAEPFRTALVAVTDAWMADLGDRLRSLVLFGSVARGQARPTSDIDVVVVADGLPRSLAARRHPLLEAWERARRARGLPHVEWNLVVKSPEEARAQALRHVEFVADTCTRLPSEAG